MIIAEQKKDFFVQEEQCPLLMNVMRNVETDDTLGSNNAMTGIQMQEMGVMGTV